MRSEPAWVGEARHLRKMGVKVVDIAKKFGVSKYTVYKYGVKTYRRPLIKISVKIHDRIQKIADLRETTFSKICTELLTEAFEAREKQWARGVGGKNEHP